MHHIEMQIENQKELARESRVSVQRCIIAFDSVGQRGDKTEAMKAVLDFLGVDYVE